MIEFILLRNFKSIGYAEFNVEPLTLFSGLNGVGKSSVLQSLLLLRQSKEKHILEAEGLSLTGEYSNLGVGRDVLYSNSELDEIEINVEWEESRFEGIFEYRERSDLLPKKSIVFGDQLDSKNVYLESLFTESFQYLSADRISPKSSYEVSDFAVNQRRSLGKSGEYTAHFLAEHGDILIEVTSLVHPESKSKSLIDNVNAWMSNISPGARVVAKLIPEINQASLHYQFEEDNGLTPQIRPQNTGFGLTYVLPVLTAILSSKVGDLIIVENPESHLHPAGQAALANLVALASSAGVQIIVETHSDHFLNGVRIAVRKQHIKPEDVCVYFLGRPKSRDSGVNIQEIRIDKLGRIDHWPDFFFDQWEKSLDSLLDGDL
ncbi:AAA family ATPase [Reinekea sp.]|jgi:predicted ATPase|uniref:AAA family ATPase n=1 Tax=Reinekea sp. TaxID=1970455 RepID=UPI0039896DAF